MADERGAETPEERRARGLALFDEVYGGLVPAPPPGASRAFELLVLEQQFAEVWADRTLDITSRRLLTMGVVAARGEYQTLELQFRCALRQGELSVEQVRAAAIHLISYAGTPLAGGILAAAETAITETEPA
ncbi:MAG: carboxymuconolactone decarboxylase family protein [Acidimicrobiales bacterium]|nr:carboxymuconolactone decarboxylase family protein [Acidimicrobiales bacterium]